MVVVVNAAAAIAAAVLNYGVNKAQQPSFFLPDLHKNCIMRSRRRSQRTKWGTSIGRTMVQMHLFTAEHEYTLF